MRVGFEVESVAPVSTRIWQSFSLILIVVSPCVFKGITGNSLPENPPEFHQLWEGPMWVPPSEVDIRTFKKNLYRVVESLPVSQLIIAFL